MATQHFRIIKFTFIIFIILKKYLDIDMEITPHYHK